VASVNALTGEQVSAWMREHEPAVDAVAAAVLLACCVWLGLAVGTPAGYFALTAALIVPVAFRRRWPAACLITVLAVALVQWLTVRDTIGMLPADVAVLVAVAAAAARGPRWAGWLGLAGGLAGAGLGGLTWPLLRTAVPSHLLTAGFLGSAVVAGWAIGTLSGVRRKQLHAVAERASLLELEREQRDQLAVLAERARIAREMHDVLAHSLAGIIAQSDGGRYAGSFEAARNALATIGDHSRQALAESRRVLGALHEGGDGRVSDGRAGDGRAGDGRAVVAPRQPGARDIPDLVERVRAGGLDVRLRLELPSDPFEPDLSLIVYRVVQEGLTNVIKHAVAATRADVKVSWGRHKLTIAVADDGQGPCAAPAGAGGYGMAGMRERVRAYGGTVTLQPHLGGGHVLSVQVPVRS